MLLLFSSLNLSALEFTIVHIYVPIPRPLWLIFINLLLWILSNKYFGLHSSFLSFTNKFVLGLFSQIFFYHINISAFCPHGQFSYFQMFTDTFSWKYWSFNWKLLKLVCYLIFCISFSSSIFFSNSWFIHAKNLCANFRNFSFIRQLVICLFVLVLLVTNGRLVQENQKCKHTLLAVMNPTICMDHNHGPGLMERLL